MISFIRFGVVVLMMLAVTVGCKTIMPVAPPSRPIVTPPAPNLPQTNATTNPSQTGGVPSSGTLPSGDTPPPAVTVVTPTTRATYQPFTKAAYNQAKAAKRPIYLYFAANWCPTCQTQDPITLQFFTDNADSLHGVAAFRVNYNDTETDADEKALAQEFGVTYQHTMFVVDANGVVLRKAIGSRSAVMLAEDLATIK